MGGYGTFSGPNVTLIDYEIAQRGQPCFLQGYRWLCMGWHRSGLSTKG
jgi:hypothetical protein